MLLYNLARALSAMYIVYQLFCRKQRGDIIVHQGRLPEVLRFQWLQKNFYIFCQKIHVIPKSSLVVLGSLGVMCSLRDPRFTSSNPTEVDGFFQDVKILSTNPPGGTL